MGARGQCPIRERFFIKRQGPRIDFKALADRFAAGAEAILCELQSAGIGVGCFLLDGQIFAQFFSEAGALLRVNFEQPAELVIVHRAGGGTIALLRPVAGIDKLADKLGF